tara:strand:+ start:237 stop:368 length:132 start_codon:yes stop_codon:yes gene_type:complete
VTPIAALIRYPANAAIQGDIAPSTSGLRLSPENGNKIELIHHG